VIIHIYDSNKKRVIKNNNIGKCYKKYGWIKIVTISGLQYLYLKLYLFFFWRRVGNSSYFPIWTTCFRHAGFCRLMVISYFPGQSSFLHNPHLLTQSFCFWSATANNFSTNTAMPFVSFSFLGCWRATLYHCLMLLLLIIAFQRRKQGS
jgi:hypothetical protein